MSLKLAFAGFRHGHILSLYSRGREHEQIDITGACEEHAQTAQSLTAGAEVDLTHTDFEDMLSSVECDAIAVGDYYGRRGSLIARALEAGKHAISDKPLCTSLSELDRIEELTRSTGLKVGCMLTMRDSAPMRGLRQLLRDDAIGELHAINFGGQHPLLLGSRPQWYFEEGKHGGTINDIGIHAIDGIPWMTGLQFARLEAGRCWNAFAEDAPHFHDGAQLMMTLSNGCGVIGDVSYFAPDAAGYHLPMYWRMTLWGRRGLIETSSTARRIYIVREADRQLEELALPEDNEGGYLEAFLSDIAGVPAADGELDTAAVLASARLALQVQQAADEGRTHVDLRRSGGDAPQPLVC